MNDKILKSTFYKVELTFRSFDLLSLLYRNHEGVASPALLLPERYRDQASFMSLERLRKAGFIEFEFDKYRLSERMESILDLYNDNFTDISPEHISGDRNKLHNLIEEYTTRKGQGEDLSVVYNNIFRRLSMAVWNVSNALSNLNQSVEEVYSIEPNFVVKKMLLEQSTLTFLKLEKEAMGARTDVVYFGLYQFIKDELPLDETLERYSQYFSCRLNSIWNSVSDSIYDKICTYLTKVNIINADAVKIEKLYELLISGKLRSCSNLYKGHDRYYPASLEPAHSLPLSIEGDMVEDNHSLVREAGLIHDIKEARISRTSRRVRRESGVDGAQENGLDDVFRMNLFVRRAFEDYSSSKSTESLSDYIMSYDFREEVDFVTRYSVLLKITFVYMDMLYFPEDGTRLRYDGDEYGFTCENVYLKDLSDV